MTEIRNDRVQLRPVDNDDINVFFEQQLDPEANQMAAFTTKDPSDRVSFNERWDKIRADKSIIIRTILFEGQVAGSILSHSWFGDIEVSYWLGREYWGQGIATQALAAFVEIQRFRPLFGRVAQDNAGSIRVMEKCGFHFFKEERGYANARGQEIDEFVMKLS